MSSKVRMKGGRVNVIPRSVMGKLLDAVNVDTVDKLPELDKRLSIGPITLVFVYAPWCGHCKRFEPTMDKLEAMPERTIQIARVRDDMFPQSSIASNKLDGYPTLMLFKNGKVIKFKGKDGQLSNSLPDHNNEAVMNAVVTKMGTPSGIESLNSAGVKVEDQNDDEDQDPNSYESNSRQNIITSNKTNEVQRLEEEVFKNSKGKPLTSVNINGNLSRNMNNPRNPENDAIPNDRIIPGKLPKAIVAEQNKVLVGGKQHIGGSLFASLSAIVSKLAPAASLFLASQSSQGSQGSQGNKTRKRRPTTRRKTSKRN